MALLLVSLPATALPALPLSDAPDGVTCRHFAAGANIAWQKSGGDWVDADGKAYGARPFVTEQIGITRERQVVSWDVTDLVRLWQEGGALAGVLFLRAPPGTQGGAVNFNSREHADPAARPMLMIEWGGGERVRSGALADSHLPCSTRSSVGGRPAFQVGGDTGAVLAFAFDDKAPRPIARAQLLLSTDKQYRGGAVIGVYGAIARASAGAVPLAGIAAGFPRDQGLERHPAVVFTDRFESPHWAARWSVYGKNSTTDIVEADAANRFEPLDGKALRVTVKKGHVLGLSAHYRFAETPLGEPEEMYFRYYLRLGDNWDPVLQGGKLPGFSGTYNRGGWGGRRANGTNGWSARGTFFRWRDRDSPLNDRRGIGSYVYHADMRNAYGSTWGWNDGPTGMLEKNRWYSVEQYVKMNTPGRNDGVLRAWIDGQIAFEKTDLRYRDIPDLKIESLWMNVYHGGTTPAAEDLTLYIDNLVIASKYVGPATLSERKEVAQSQDRRGRRVTADQTGMGR